MLAGPGLSRKNPGCPEIVLWDVLLEMDLVLLDEIGVVGLLRCHSLNPKSRQSRQVHAQGIRAIPMTAGQHVLGFPVEIMQRLSSHSIVYKIWMAYDRSRNA